MSQRNPTNPNSEFAIIYTAEGNAHGGDYATPEIAFAVLCGRLGWDPETARMKAIAQKDPREWVVLRDSSMKRDDAPRVVEVL